MRIHGLGYVAAGAVLVVLVSVGCSRPVDTATYGVRQMGERVEVGPLIVSVLEAEWLAQLGDGPGARLPQNRFLLLRVSITNSGGTGISVPGMVLEHPNGQTYAELSEGENVENWLPPIRTVAPAETRDGRIAFDAPPSAYKLRIREEADFSNDAAKDRSVLIDIPLNLQAPVRVPTR